MAKTTPEQPKLTRLLRLMQELQLRPRQTPRELWTRLGISRSTFHADKNLLSKAGFEWHFNKQRNGYVYVGKDIVPHLNLSLREALAMVQAVRQFAAAGDSVLAFDAVEGLKKLIAVTPKTTRELLFSVLDDLLKRTFRATPSIVNTLVEAQRNQQSLSVVYRDRSRGKTERYWISPYVLFIQGGAFYVDAFVREQNAVRNLRVSRIEKIESFGGCFEIPPDYDFVERHRYTFRAFRSDHPPQRVKIKFDAKVADLILESNRFNGERKLQGKDGGVVYVAEVAEPREVLWYLVLPYAEHAEILEPEWLREEFVRVARTVLDRHA